MKCVYPWLDDLWFALKCILGGIFMVKIFFCISNIHPWLICLFYLFISLLGRLPHMIWLGWHITTWSYSASSTVNTAGINIVLHNPSYQCDQCIHIFRHRKSAYLTANTSIRNFGNVYPIIIDFLFQLLTPVSRSNIKI